MSSSPALMVKKIPDSVRAMIRQKCEVLEPDARLALQYASIAGEEFLSSVVARLLDTEQLRVEEGFVALAQNHRHPGADKPHSTARRVPARTL